MDNVENALSDKVKTELKKAFRSGFDEIRMEKVLKLSNFSCTMKQAGLWNEDNSINMEYYGEGIFEGVS